MDSPLRNYEWLPLASQQLRLRHLVRVIGLNILCSKKCKLYFTLHHKFNCPAFYQSAHMQQCGNSEAVLWDHIVCPEMRKSNSRTVCIRIWEHNPNDLEEQNKLLFTWKVWFSGLILTGSCSEAQYFSNTLIFQLGANCFSSPKHFSSFSLENNELSSEVPVECDQNIIKVYTSESWEENDPIHSQLLTNSKSKHMDSLSDLSGIRCMSVLCPRNTTGQSYDLEKLLRIQKIQRSCKRLKEATHNITHQIVNYHLTRRNRTSSRRTIDYLLSDLYEISPQVKIECHAIKKKIESLRFQCNLLEKERDYYRVRTEQLLNQLHQVKQSKLDAEQTLEERYTQLSNDKSIVYKRIKVILNNIRVKRELEQKINKRWSILCAELKYLYPINKNSRGCFTVCSIPFPDKDYLSSNPLHTDHIKLLTPATLSVTLGFVEHLVQITATILDKPLRFPLQFRSSIPSKQILYGIYLLNQNIAQLNYDVFELRVDPRATLENFLKLFCSIIKTGENEQDGEVSILDDINRIEDFQKAKTALKTSALQVERVPMRKPLAIEEKRYHSEDDLKSLAAHCLKHSYSQERLDKE